MAPTNFPVEIVRFPTAMDYFGKQTSISHERRIFAYGKWIISYEKKFIADWKNHFFHGKRKISTGNYPIPTEII
jgi:hypothetical protein